MLSKVKIANQALLRCGNYEQIEGLDWGNPQTSEEMLATRFYDDVRRECLSMAPWGFAESEVAPSQLSDWPDGQKWPYAYPYPSDCVRMREVWSAYRDKPLDWRLGNFQNTKIVKSKYEADNFIYTLDLDDPSRYSPSFASMFSWKLAMAFGLALGLSKSQIDTLMNGFTLDHSAALAINASEQEEEEDFDAEWIEERGYSPNGYQR